MSDAIQQARIEYLHVHDWDCEDDAHEREDLANPCPCEIAAFDRLLAAVRDTTAREYQSRLEALETEVQAKDSALKSIIDTFHSDSRPMGHVARAMLAIAAEALTAPTPARLRELSGQPEAQQETR